MWALMEGGVITYFQLVLIAIAGACVLSITVYTLETVARKNVEKATHNLRVAGDNGVMLVGATVRAEAQFEETVGAPGAAGATGVLGVASVASLLADLKGVVEKYELCNSVMAGRAEMPMPWAEAVVFAVVALVFLSLAVVITVQSDPLKRMDSIKTLRGLAERIRVGDPAALLDAESLAACATPPDATTVYMVFGCCILVAITIWFASANASAVDDYVDRLEELNDCVD
jgi:hypothetical protein